MSKVSLIVPVYKVEPYLPKCLDSIVNQTLEDIQIILVDDGSPDNCGAICDEYAARNSRITVVHKQNQGLSAARNDGIAFVNGEYFTFVDSDDWCELDMCENMYAFAHENDLDILMADYFNERGNKTVVQKFTKKGFITRDKKRVDRMTEAVLCNNFPDEHFFYFSGFPWNRLYHSRLLAYDDVRFIPALRAHEDALFNLYAYAHAKKVGYMTVPFYHYRYVASSIVHKYNPDRVAVDTGIANEIYAFQQKYRPDLSFDQARMSNIIWLFFRCNDRCFFNDSNSQTFWQKLGTVRQVLNEEPYHSAFHLVDPAYLTAKQRLVLPFARGNYPLILWMFYVVNRWITRSKKG